MNMINKCSDSVINNNAEEVFNIARSQSNKKLWKLPTNKQINDMTTIIESWYSIYFKTYTNEDNTVNNMLSACNSLNLICQRACTDDDDYLIIYVKKGINNYNGPFMMLRLKNASPVIIISPHDGSDSTCVSTKLAFKNSRAIACICNGHIKWERKYDFSKNSNCLGYHVLKIISNLIKRPVLLNIHGMRYNNLILVRSRSKLLRNIFMNEYNIHTGIDDFKQFNAWYAIDKIKTPYSLKTEIPVRIHLNRKNLLGKVISKIEETFIHAEPNY